MQSTENVTLKEVKSTASINDEITIAASPSTANLMAAVPEQSSDTNPKFWARNKDRIIWWCKICIPLIIFFIFAIPIVDLEPGKPNVSRGAAVALLTALWWIFEPVPLGVTSFVPAVVVPLLGITDGNKIASSYFSHIQFLLLGGFIISEAMQRWQLQKRISLKVLSYTGLSPVLNLLGLMIIRFTLFLFMSNTSSAVALMPNALAIAAKIEDQLGKNLDTARIGKALVFCVAVVASLGGTVTLVGTPPNAMLVDILLKNFPDLPELTFIDWFKMSMPMGALVFVICFLYFAYVMCPRKTSKPNTDIEMTPMDGTVTAAPTESPFAEEYKKLGNMSPGEKTTAWLFALAIFLWLFRADMDLGFVKIAGWIHWFPQPKYIPDGLVGGLIGFLVFAWYTTDPKTGKTVKLLDFKSTFQKLPWDITILIGAGFALSDCLTISGLSQYIGNKLETLSDMPLLLFITICCALMSALSNVGSHTAMANVFLPIAATLSKTLRVKRGIHPWTVMIPVTLANSASYMLPIGTPPNTLAYGTGRLTILDFVKHGSVLNIISVCIYGFLVPVLCPIFYGYEAKY